VVDHEGRGIVGISQGEQHPPIRTYDPSQAAQHPDCLIVVEVRVHSRDQYVVAPYVTRLEDIEHRGLELRKQPGGPVEHTWHHIRCGHVESGQGQQHVVLTFTRAHRENRTLTVQKLHQGFVEREDPAI